MSTPVFLHVMSNGEIWVSNNPNDTPTGVVTATYKISSDPKFQKIGTLSGTANLTLTATNATGKQGKEIV
jgi:hypothetical protein